MLQLTCVQYSHSAWFLDGRTSILVTQKGIYAFLPTQNASTGLETIKLPWYSHTFNVI